MDDKVETMTFDYAMAVSLISDPSGASSRVLYRAVFAPGHLFPTQAQHRAEMVELDICDERDAVAARIAELTA